MQKSYIVIETLDNILSMYRAHFEKEIISPSLVDSAEVYSDQDEIMGIYKKEFKNHIYPVNYDELVADPSGIIRSLILWLGWKWNDLYLSPHLNNRRVLQEAMFVRSPINSKSLEDGKTIKRCLNLL